MATDKSEPRSGLILKVGALAVVTLVVVHAALVAYFDRMAHGEEYRKVGSAPPDALTAIRADEKLRLTQGSMPIEKAVQTMATRGRMGVGPELTPKPSIDMAPMQGWVKLPTEVPAPMMAMATAPPAAAVIADGGAPAPAASVQAPAADAGPRDGAAPKHPRKAP